MYVHYTVNVSENQGDALKDAIRLKKCVTLCFPKGVIRGDHFLPLTPPQINRLDISDINGGAGLLMGKYSPFKNIPFLGWLL